MALPEWNQVTIRTVSDESANTQISTALTYTTGSPSQTGRGYGPWFGRRARTRYVSVQLGVIHEESVEAGAGRYAY